ncbi:hypothetical protein [Hungatella effluvii]|uniref:hypothetical protein n=1 Tax=Hungatella effluvii TaxID=1096246 RepID=UPI002A81F390|nr:hypothetical protein [Hungatella effluvii]
MLKLEIRLDEEKIRETGKYAPESLRQTLIQSFAKQQLDSVVEPDGTLFFVGRGRARDYGCFGKMITALRNQQWFMEYVDRWIWYNSDDGEDENDFSIEDVLAHYTSRVSVA